VPFSFATVAALLLSGLIGVSLGLLGGGGSILALPVLVFVARLDPRQAVAMSLAIVGATSLTASLLHRRSGRVDTRVGALFGGIGLPMAFLGARLTHLLEPRTLLSCFGALMLVVGSVMVIRALREPRGGEPVRERHPVAVVAAGAGVGFLTGFLGVGGGFLIVPALTLFAGLAMPVAVGTSLLVIAFNCAAGFVGHVHAEGVPIVPTILFTAMAIAGGVMGERLAGRTSPRRLRRAFGIFVILLGVYVLVRNLNAVVS
jgi:uncharacterized membrane protein YfcA